MPTDPYVPTPFDERPRQQQNFAPGVHMPPARSWRADRPGDTGRGMPVAPLAGTPGPNVGFALTLANRARDRLRLEPGEHLADAIAVVAEIAMKRAAAVGRAPTVVDVDFAIDLLGFGAPAADELRAWRPELIRGADHVYVVRRRIADGVPTTALRRSRADLPEVLDEVRAAMVRSAATE